MSTFCIEPLRLNDFRELQLPSRKDIYERVGFRALPYDCSTKDPREFSDPVNLPDKVSKLDALEIGYSSVLQERRAADLVNAAKIANPAVMKSNNEPSANEPSANEPSANKNLPDDTSSN